MKIAETQPYDPNQLEGQMAIRALEARGWRGISDAWFNDYGNVEFELSDAMWEVNLETDASRHCGFGEGCFWTEWEGGIEEEDCETE